MVASDSHSGPTRPFRRLFHQDLPGHSVDSSTVSFSLERPLPDSFTKLPSTAVFIHPGTFRGSCNSRIVHPSCSFRGMRRAIDGPVTMFTRLILTLENSFKTWLEFFISASCFLCYIGYCCGFFSCRFSIVFKWLLLKAIGYYLLIPILRNINYLKMYFQVRREKKVYCTVEGELHQCNNYTLTN